MRLISGSWTTADPLASAKELWGPQSIPHPGMLLPFLLSWKQESQTILVMMWACSSALDEPQATRWSPGAGPALLQEVL